MNSNFPADSWPKTIVDVASSEFIQSIESADAFVFAAGFERRALRVPLSVNVTRNPLVLTFVNGSEENAKSFTKVARKFERVPGFDVCEIDLIHLEKFEASFETCLHRLERMSTGQIVLDISGLPNFAICIALMKIRQVYPTSRLRLLYTEADDYFPRRRDFERIRRAMQTGASGSYPAYLSERAVNMFMPSMFSGVTLGQNDTCLLMFAGYEPHRTNCAIEALNPNKVVMIYGEPERPDLKWRLDLSRIMHSRIDEQLVKTEEVTSTADVGSNLQLLFDYYEYLYDDNVLCVCPTNSKLQAVASALAWERYPDIQLNFPVPTEYLPGRFSVESRSTFAIDLGVPPRAGQWLIKVRPQQETISLR
jgi:hypothetical protein